MKTHTAYIQVPCSEHPKENGCYFTNEGMLHYRDKGFYKEPFHGFVNTLIIPIAILVLLLWIIWKSLDSFEKEINVDGHNGFESEFYDDNLE